jgi:competence protein ComEC
MIRGILQRRVRRTTLIGIGSLAFLAGIGLAVLGWSVAWELALASLMLLWAARRKRLVLAVPAALVVGLLLGLWRGGAVHLEVARYDQLAEQKVTLQGVAIQDATYGNRRQVDFMVEQVRVDGRRLPGQVRVTTFDPVMPRQGDTVVVAGKAKPGFGNYQLGMYFAKVEVTQPGNSPWAWLRHQFSAAIRSVVPEPQASLGLGFLLGIKSQLPDELNDQLKVVGLTHIVVASGYNLTILVRAARRLLANRSKYQATAAATGLMVGFVGVTGFSPSMTRAALVTSLSLAAWYYGRVIHPVVLILFAAAATAAWNPLYVWGDVGWYLSFLAFGGVMLLAPLMVKRIFGDRKVPQLAQIAIETLGAELATLPLTMFVFGSVSVVSLAANLAVAPLVPAAMLLTFAAGVASVTLPGFGGWLALPATWLLSYMTSLVAWLAAVPWAKQQMNLSLVGLLAGYALLLAVGVLTWRKLRYNYLSKGVVE